MKRPGPPCSICQHAKVLEIDADGRSQAKVAKKFGISPTTLGRHRQHVKKPKANRVSRLQIGVDPAAKGQDIGAYIVRGPGFSLTSSAVVPPEAAPDPDLDPREVATETIAALRSALGTAAEEDVPRIAQAITSAARLLARLTGQLEITEAQIVRSAPFRRLMAKLDAVLVQYPGAAKAWSDALTEDS